jgi:hypothetical protein
MSAKIMSNITCYVDSHTHCEETEEIPFIWNAMIVF